MKHKVINAFFFLPLSPSHPLPWAVGQKPQAAPPLGGGETLCLLLSRVQGTVPSLLFAPFARRDDQQRGKRHSPASPVASPFPRWPGPPALPSPKHRAGGLLPALSWARSKSLPLSSWRWVRGFYLRALLLTSSRIPEKKKSVKGLRERAGFGGPSGGRWPYRLPSNQAHPCLASGEGTHGSTRTCANTHGHRHPSRCLN